jgi:hypothetical protein
MLDAMTRRAFLAVAGLPFLPPAIAPWIRFADFRRDLLAVTLAHEWREEEKNVHVSIPPDLLRRVEEAARSEHITVDEWLRQAVEFHLSQWRSRQRQRRDPQPERIDDDNPEITAEELRQARPAAEVLPHFIGQKATDELLRPKKRRG